MADIGFAGVANYAPTSTGTATGVVADGGIGGGGVGVVQSAANTGPSLDLYFANMDYYLGGPALDLFFANMDNWVDGIALNLNFITQTFSVWEAPASTQGTYGTYELPSEPQGTYQVLS